MTTIKLEDDDKEQRPEIHIHVHVYSSDEDVDRSARRIIQLINDYKRKHGGQNPLG